MQDLPIQDLITYILDGQYIAAASAALFLLVQLLKTHTFKRVFYRIPPRFRALTVVSTSTAASVLSQIHLGKPMLVAILEGVLVGGASIALHEAIFKAIFPNNGSYKITVSSRKADPSMDARRH